MHFLLNENVWMLLKIWLKCFPKFWINNIPILVQIMAWRRPGDKRLYEPMMVWSTDAYMRHSASKSEKCRYFCNNWIIPPGWFSRNGRNTIASDVLGNTWHQSSWSSYSAKIALHKMINLSECVWLHGFLIYNLCAKIIHQIHMRDLIHYIYDTATW